MVEEQFYFDGHTPILKALLIDNATLIFDDHQDVALNVEYIVIINGGRLQIGTASNPFQHRAVITMYGHLRSIELPICKFRSKRFNERFDFCAIFSWSKSLSST